MKYHESAWNPITDPGVDGRVSPACPGALIALRVDLGIPCLVIDKHPRFEGRCKFLTFSYMSIIGPMRRGDEREEGGRKKGEGGMIMRRAGQVR